MDKRVLFCIGSLEVGGAEKQLVLLVEALQARGWCCDVAVLEAGGELTQRLEASGARIYPLGFRTGRGPLIMLEILSSLFSMWRLIRRNRYPVVHGYLPLANFIAALAAKCSLVPLILTSKRALGTHQDRHPLWRLFEKVANACSHRIIANSLGVKNDVVSRECVNPQKIDVIYNGLDFDLISAAQVQRESSRQALGLKEQDVVAVVVANLIPYKGHADVIRAAALVGQGRGRVTYIFVGEDRGIQQELELLVKELSVSRVVFLGRRSDVPALLAAADIGLVPSHEEGFCNALLEQMAASLPVVATRVGGNAEALSESEFGVLVDAHSPKQLADAIDTLVVKSELRSEYGVKASRRVKDLYSVDTMVACHVELYLKRDVD